MNWRSIIAAAVTCLLIVAPFVYAVLQKPAEITYIPNVQPESKITVPTVINNEESSILVHRVQVGELIKLESDGQFVAWDCVPSIADMVTYGERNGQCAVSFRQRGRYHVLVAPNDDGKVKIRQIVIIVGDGDEKVVDNTKTRWDSLVSQWIGDDTSEDRRSEAKKLGQSFYTVADQVEQSLNDGKLVTVDQVIAMTAEANKTALAVSRSDWTGFRAKLNDELKALSASGNLGTMKQHIVVWREIAAALDRHSK